MATIFLEQMDCDVFDAARYGAEAAGLTFDEAIQHGTDAAEQFLAAVRAKVIG